MLGVSLFELGNFAAAIHRLETAACLLNDRQRQAIANRGDAGVMIPAWLGFVLVFHGYLDRAVLYRDLCVSEADTSASLHTRAFALNFAAGITSVLGEFGQLLGQADASCALTTELKFPLMLAWGWGWQGIAKLSWAGQTAKRRCAPDWLSTDAAEEDGDCRSG